MHLFDVKSTLSANRKARKLQQKKTVFNEEEVLASEKWLVRFRNPNLIEGRRRSGFVRQFYAPGFYEAYDTVMTYAERTKVEILWFKEKRKCGDEYLNRNFQELESFCTYCNKRFNHTEPIPCPDGECIAEFCSNQCARGHHVLRHVHP